MMKINKDWVIHDVGARRRLALGDPAGRPYSITRYMSKTLIIRRYRLFDRTRDGNDEDTEIESEGRIGGHHLW